LPLLAIRLWQMRGGNAYLGQSFLRAIFWAQYF